MEIGTSVAIVGVSFAVTCGLIGIFRKPAEKASVCALHDMMSKQIDEFRGWLIRVEGKIDTAIREINK